MKISSGGMSWLMQKDRAFMRMDNQYISGWAETEVKNALALILPDKVDANIDYVGPKLSLDKFLKVLGLFKWASNIFGEATVVLVDNDGELDVLVPEQHGTAAHSTYIKPDTGSKLIVGTIHSHPKMGAFWSGTDKHDQLKMSGMHVVLGLDTVGDVKVSLCSLFCMKTQKDYPLEFFVEGYDKQPADAFPEEWKSMFKIDPIPIPRGAADTVQEPRCNKKTWSELAAEGIYFDDVGAAYRDNIILTDEEYNLYVDLFAESIKVDKGTKGPDGLPVMKGCYAIFSAGTGELPHRLYMYSHEGEPPTVVLLDDGYYNDSDQSFAEIIQKGIPVLTTLNDVLASAVDIDNEVWSELTAEKLLFELEEK